MSRNGFDDTDDQMSASDIAAFFKEKPSKVKKGKKTQAAEELIDIYAIAARVKNAVTFSGGALNSAGVILCNSYVHVLKALYEFANTLPPKKKGELVALLRSHESMPANVSIALKNGVKEK